MIQTRSVSRNQGITYLVRPLFALTCQNPSFFKGFFNVLASLPPELEAFIKSEVASGKYASTDEAVSEAIRLLQEREQHFSCLKSDLAEGLAAFESGDVVIIQTESDRQFLIDDISRRGRERLQASHGNT